MLVGHTTMIKMKNWSKGKTLDWNTQNKTKHGIVLCLEPHLYGNLKMYKHNPTYSNFKPQTIHKKLGYIDKFTALHICQESSKLILLCSFLVKCG